MKTLARLLTAAAIAAACILPNAARAQGIDISSFTAATLPTTFSIAAATTNTTLASSNIVIEVTRGANVAIQMAHKLQGAGTSAVVWTFDESVNGVSWERNVHSVSVTASSTNEVVTASNFSLGGISYLRLSTCQNPNASAVTNIAGWKGVKSGL